MQVKDKLHTVEIPALFMGGWFDALLDSTLQAYHAYSGPRMLWIGPWTLEEMTGRAGDKFFENGEQEIGADRMKDPTDIHIKWFDKWLKDKPMPIEKPVHLYLMGQKRWGSYEQWPPAANEKVLYLASYGDSQTRDGDEQLVDATVVSSSVSPLQLDPSHPVPTRGGGALIARYASGMFEIGDIQNREDVLVYTYAPSEEINILGTVKARIWVSSSTPLMDIAVRLSDVEPAEDVFNIIDTFHREKVAEKDQPFFMYIEIGHTAYSLQAGHQLRLDIVASNAPLYDVNLNNGKTTKTAATGNMAVEHIYHP